MKLSITTPDKVSPSISRPVLVCDRKGKTLRTLFPAKTEAWCEGDPLPPPPRNRKKSNG